MHQLTNLIILSPKIIKITTIKIEQIIKSERMSLLLWQRNILRYKNAYRVKQLS